MARHLHLFDNDFFGQPREEWLTRVEEVVAGKFKVCLNQGINVRTVDDESAVALKRMGYWDDSFKVRRLYTAWDNLGDEERFFRGVDTLARHGIPPTHLMVYMLVGYDRRETWERVLYRFDRMAERGIRPYPMIYDRERPHGLELGGASPRLEKRTLADFQRWAIRRYYTVVPFELYDCNEKLPRRHWTPEQKRNLVATLLKTEPQRSNRETAKLAKVDGKTVAAVRRKLEAGAELPHLAKSIGADGKAYPSRVPPKPAASRQTNLELTDLMHIAGTPLDAARWLYHVLGSSSFYDLLEAMDEVWNGDGADAEQTPAAKTDPDEIPFFLKRDPAAAAAGN